MERWLSKTRVLLALSCMSLVSALNHHSPMIFGMFLLLVTVSTLGLIVPWLSLRTMQLAASGTVEVVEGKPPPGFELTLEHRAWWPAFMVDVSTQWRWGDTTTALHQTIPVLKRGHRQALDPRTVFHCRGRYKLAEIILSSGFPLGMVTARRHWGPQGVSVLVLPRAQAVDLPSPLQLADDPFGEQATRRLGHSDELGLLRSYVTGDPVGRINWRASARAGELVIQHFQRSGSPLIHLVTDIPTFQELAQPDAPAEHALRIATGICQQAATQGVRICAHLPRHELPLTDPADIARALADSLPGPQLLEQMLERASRGLPQGAHLVVIANPRRDTEKFTALLTQQVPHDCRLTVYLAIHPTHSASDQVLATTMAQSLASAGIHTVAHYPA